jgi:sugar phosphate isomerase/epimerase
MPRSDGLPVLGAAMPLAHLAHHRDWLLEAPRDLEIQDFCDLDVLAGDWRGRVAAIRPLLAGLTGRLGIHGPFWGLRIDSHDPEIRAVVTRRLLQGIDAAAALGATQMVVHSPFTTWDAHHLPLLPGARDAVIDRARETLAPVIARAETDGVELVIENIEDRDPVDRVMLVRALDSRAVRVSLDTGHARYAHGSTGAPPVDAYIVAAGDLLAHVHLQDADGYADRHWHPGEGDIAWPAVFAALARLAADPRLILEVKDVRGLRKGAAHLVGLGLAC